MPTGSVSSSVVDGQHLDRDVGLHGREPDPVDGLRGGAGDRDDHGVGPGRPDLRHPASRWARERARSRILRCRLYGSSSSSPTGRHWCSGSRSMDPIRSRAASPAPTTTTRAASSRLAPSASRSRSRRHSARPQAASTSAPRVAPAGTLRGTHWATRFRTKATVPVASVTVPRQHHLLEARRREPPLVHAQDRRDGQVQRHGRQGDGRDLLPRHGLGHRIEPQPDEEVVRAQPSSHVVPDGQGSAMLPQARFDVAHD